MYVAVSPLIKTPSGDPSEDPEKNGPLLKVKVLPFPSVRESIIRRSLKVEFPLFSTLML